MFKKWIYHKHMSHEKSCGTVVFRKEKKEIRYLLLHYGAGHWDFPKGHVEPHETWEQTALRELKEETGIADAKIADRFKEKISYFFKMEKEVVHKEVIFFVAETKEKNVTISREHSGYEWLGSEKAHEKLTFKTAKDILAKANEFILRDS